LKKEEEEEEEKEETVSRLDETCERKEKKLVKPAI